MKNQAFIDGNKRIAAILFIYFLQFYGILTRNGKDIISDKTLASLTLLIAESNPQEKSTMIDLIIYLVIKRRKFMPEIAEVQTVRETLKKRILNKKIKEINIIYERMIESDLDEFKTILIGKSFQDIQRIGKWLLFDIEDYFLLSHLRMEGKYFIKTHEEPIAKHEHVIFTFEDGSELRYHDVRKFGKMSLVKKADLYDIEAIKKQGIEPIDPKLNADYLLNKFRNKHMPIKTALLDQTIISGLGNIYADEVLFRAGLNPIREAGTIRKKEAEKIVSACNAVISKAIEAGGTTIRSYTSSLGVTGTFQKELMVHQQKDKPCKICGTTIEKIKVGGRGTYFCKKCQK